MIHPGQIPPLKMAHESEESLKKNLWLIFINDQYLYLQIFKE